MTIPIDEEENKRSEEGTLSTNEDMKENEKLYAKQVIVECEFTSNNPLEENVNFVYTNAVPKMCEFLYILLTSACTILSFMMAFLVKILKYDPKYHRGRLKLHNLSNSMAMSGLHNKYSKKENIIDFFARQLHTIPQLKLCIYPFFPSSFDLFQNGKRKPELDTMQYESSRLASFASFPFLTGVYATKLASAGFYYAGRADETVCFSCGLKHRHWNGHVSPIDIHKEKSPNCSFIKEIVPQRSRDVPSIETSNVAQTGACGTSRDIIEADNTRSLVQNGLFRLSGETSNNHEYSHKHNENKNYTTDSNIDVKEERIHNVTISESHNDTRSLISLPTNETGRHPLVSKQENFRTTNEQPKQSVSRGNGSETNPVSFGLPKYPQYALKSSRLHSFALWPHHLAQTPEEMSAAGFFFTEIEDHCRCFFCGGGLKHWEPNDRPLEEHDRWYPHCSFLQQIKEIPSSLDKANKETKEEPSNLPVIQDFQNHSAAVTVAELGYDQTTINRALDHLQNTKSPDINASVLLETIFNLEEDLKTKSQARNKTQQNITGNSSANQNSVPTALDEDFELSVKSLEEENQALRDQQTCKICLDEPIAIVFLPCGHMASCKTCAPALRRCPICRAFIKGTVKAIMC